MNKLAAASNLKFWTSFRGGGVLAFGPTLALDLYYNTSRDANGLHFDANKFGRDQLKNQSGNAVGFAAGVIVGIFFGASAPVIIAGFIAGFALQMVWNAYGMPDKMEKLPDNLDKIQQWQKKNIGPTEEEIRMYTQE